MVKHRRLQIIITFLLFFLICQQFTPPLLASARDFPVLPYGISSYSFLPSSNYILSDTKALLKINSDALGLPTLNIVWKNPQGTAVSCGSICTTTYSYSPNGYVIASTSEFYISGQNRVPGTYTAIVNYCTNKIGSTCIGWAESFRANFFIADNTYTISGNAGVGGVTLSYVDITTKSVVADGAGNYSITVPSGWSGMVTPSKTNYTFTPSSKTYTNIAGNQTAQNYAATVESVTYSISGNAGVSGVTLSYMDGTAKTVMADGTGNYSIAVPGGWSGTVQPSKPNYTFSPASITYATLAGNQTAQNYVATEANNTYSISGTTGVGGVTLSYVDGITKTIVADGAGNYSITVPSGWSGTVTPSKISYFFLPASRTYSNLAANQTGQNYSATKYNYSCYLPLLIR